MITHPYLKEKISWGLVPYVQALLLARYLRDDLDAYPPLSVCSTLRNAGSFSTSCVRS